jgi:hypothetical protein
MATRATTRGMLFIITPVLILATERGGSEALSGERVEFVASRIGKAVARQGVAPDALAKIGCQLDGEREATYISHEHVHAGPEWVGVNAPPAAERQSSGDRRGGLKKCQKVF